MDKFRKTAKIGQSEGRKIRGLQKITTVLT